MARSNLDFKPLYSSYPNLRDTIVDWLPMDTKELFEKNKKDKRQLQKLKMYGWLDNKFSYRFNKQGFRCDDFDHTQRDSIVFLGCSNTVGIGLPYEKTHPYIVSKELNLKCYNLGKGGGSNDSAFRIGSYWIPILKPKLVCMLTPSKERLEVIECNGEVNNILPSRQPKVFKTFYQHWLLNDNNSTLNQEKNLNAINWICHETQVPFVQLSVDYLYQHIKDTARDLSHPGVMSQKIVADKFLQLLS